MYSAQDLSTAVKSIANGFRPLADSISLDVSEATDVDVLLTYAMSARSLDEASAAVERVLEIEPENEVANAGFTWFIGLRDSADRLEQSSATEDLDESESQDDVPTAKATAGDTVRGEDVGSSEGSEFSAELPFAFQQVVEPLIASKEQEEDTAEVEATAEATAQAEQEEKDKAEAEAAAQAEQEEKDKAEAEATAQAEQEEKDKAEAEAAAQAEQEEKDKAEAEAAAQAEQEEKDKAEAAATAEQEEKDKAKAEAEAEATAKAEQEAVEQEEKVAAEAEKLAGEVHEAAVAPSLSSTSVPAQVPGEKITILTVDDSPTIRKLLMMTLEREGFNVVQAQDGVEALVKMSECNPSMILSDINMPRLDGYKLCKFVKKHEKTKHIPVIMLSGKDGVFDKLRGRMSGCDGYLTKPFESIDLLEKIRSFVGTIA